MWVKSPGKKRYVTLEWPHRTMVRNVKIALFGKIVLLLHPHVDVPCSLVVT